MSSALIFGVAVIALMIVTSVIIHTFFPKFKKYEPLMLIVEFASLFLAFL